MLYIHTINLSFCLLKYPVWDEESNALVYCNAPAGLMLVSFFLFPAYQVKKNPVVQDLVPLLKKAKQTPAHRQLRSIAYLTPTGHNSVRSAGEDKWVSEY